MRRPARDFLRQATALVSIAAVLGGPTTARAGTIYWNMQTATATSNDVPNVTPGALVQGNNNGTTTMLGSSSASSGYTFTLNGVSTSASGTNNAGAAARIGSLVTGANGSAYFEFILTPDAGYSLTLSDIGFGSRSTSTGPVTYTLRSSLDSYASDLTTPAALPGSTWGYRTSSLATATTATSAVTYRLYGYAGSGSASANTANWRIDDLMLIVNSAQSGGGGGPNYYWVGADTTLGGTGTWTQTGGTAWRPTDTDGAGEAWESSKIATFGGASSGTVTVTDTVTANAGLAFATSGYTLTGGTVSLGGADAAANTITTDAATSIAITSVLAGSSGLTKAGPGSLTLGGANTYAGGTTVSAGTLSVSADANLGSSAGGITLGGGRLELTSGFTLGSNRTITAATGTSSTIAVTSGTVSYAGPFTGSGNLDKAGAGTLSVGNASSGYSGTFTISAGTLEVTAANAFANATLTQTGGTLLLAPAGGGDVVIPEIGGSGGEVSVDSGASAVFRGNSDRAYDGRIRGQGAFKKEGNGILTLNADNDFTGNTRITQGRLKLGAAGGLSATPQIAIDSGAIFDVADRSGFALGTGQRLGGRGTVLGDLQFGGGSQLAFDPTGPLLVGSGTVSFASGFGIGSIFGLDANVAEGTYTLLNETTGGSISFASLANVGPGNPFDLGGGKSAYFQQGSLQVVVVPEPDAFFIGGLGLALAGLMANRRRSRGAAA